ncbi:MAG: hypothetical protein QOJ94_1342 [Sphingomonadales bacterium]|jgi:hypothetical protein|nr:hypothetical protein [Sphingomonadales bacterium]
MILAVLAALAAAAPNAPHPAEPKLFKDWTVGCDNGRACLAVGLQPEADPEGWLTLDFARGPGPEARPSIEIDVEAPAGAGVYADGRKLPVVLGTGKQSGKVIGGADALVAALRSATKLDIRDPSGKRLGSISPAGASAALLFMDDKQGRVGTATALARPGPKPAAAMPTPPAYPVVHAAPRSAKPPRRMARTEWVRLRLAACDDGDPDDGTPADFYRLDAAHSLASIPAHCLSGAYNGASLLYVAGETGPWRPAPYDYTLDNGAGEGSAALQFNADYDPRTGILEMFMKGRGLNDCGTTENYAWDGTRFRLTYAGRMDECRGAMSRIPVWRATVR